MFSKNMNLQINREVILNHITNKILVGFSVNEKKQITQAENEKQEKENQMTNK